MNPIALARTAAGLVVSAGAGAIVSNAIKASTPANAKIIQKISIGIGGFVLSNMIGDMATKYANDNIDTAVNTFKQAKEAVINPPVEESNS